MKRKLAFLASLDYSAMKPADVCRSLSKLGYDGVEWTLKHFNPRTKTPAENKELVEITHDHNLEISEACVQQDIVCLDDAVREDRIKLVLECIEAAAEFGISTLNVFTGPAPWNPKAPRIGRDVSEGDAWGLVLDAFRRFEALATKHEVNLAVENVFGMLCHDYYSAKPLLDAMDSPWLGVNLDVSHDVLHGILDVGWIIRQWADKIKHIHLKDAVGIPRMGSFLFPMLGEGQVDWDSHSQALDDIGYDGFMSVEFESFAYYKRVLDSDPEAAAKVSIEQVRKLFA